MENEVNVIEQISDIIEIEDGSTIEAVEQTVEIIEVGVQGPQGPPGPSGTSVPAIYFDHGDATPKTLYTPSSDQVIKSLSLIVLIPFNGASPTVSIGTDADSDLFMSVDDNDLTITSTYETSPGETVLNGDPVKAFITPGIGTTQGRCMVLIEYASA